jgi:oxygen-dependent protoporphyrinogen oxidase
MIGGTRWREAVDLPDDVIADQVRADLDRILGLSGQADVLAITRYQRAVAQPGRDHLRRIARIRSNLAGEPGLALAGSYVAGVGIPDAFASGARAAREVLSNDATSASDGRVAGAI